MKKETIIGVVLMFALLITLAVGSVYSAYQEYLEVKQIKKEVFENSVELRALQMGREMQ